MHVVSIADPVEFLARAEPVLLADEARHNLQLGIAATVRDAPEYYGEARFWLVEQDGAVVGAALRTPPLNLVLAAPLADGVVDVLAAAIDDDLPGVTGALPEAEAFAEAWTRAHGGVRDVRMAQRIHALNTVADEGSAPGGMRDATLDDRALAVRWWHAFSVEAIGDTRPWRPAIADAERAVDLRLDANDSGIVVWEHDGDVVSLAGFASPTPNGIRIGPVYTPPELRGKGYATSLVARLSRRLLAAGYRFCFLYTDLANPTSNRIYARIGYEPVCDSAEIAFASG